MQVKARSKKLADLREYLETERQRLKNEIAHSQLSVDDEHAGYGNHMAEGAAVVFEQAKSVGLKRSQELMLAEVEDALKRMDDGTYGICRHCGQAIDTARLKALPTAALCFECQELRDSR